MTTDSNIIKQWKSENPLEPTGAIRDNLLECVRRFYDLTAKQFENEAYSGSLLNSAGRELDCLNWYIMGYNRRTPSKLKELEEQIKLEKDNEYQEYLRLKKKFEK